MERVLNRVFLKAIILSLCLLWFAQSALATTVVRPLDDDMIVGARVIITGKVLQIESAIDEGQDRIYTYITVRVSDVIKGQVADQKIILKEPGGVVGDRISVVYGSPEFKLGEKVLLYLGTHEDGSLRTYQLFLGKFSIVKDKTSGSKFAVRDTGGENVTVLTRLPGQTQGETTDRMEISSYVDMVRNKVAANLDRSQAFEEKYFKNVPVLATPRGYVSSKKQVRPDYTFLGNVRWFQPDTGQVVPYTVNPNPSADPTVPQVVVDPNDVAAAANAWSVVPGCSLRLSYSGSLASCYTQTGTFGVNIVSNNCDGYNQPTAGCASILAIGGWSGGGSQTRVIGGITFGQITQGFVSFNPWASCYLSDHCQLPTGPSVQEIATHEMGHALGLAHSADPTATMYYIAHFDGRCASLKQDDMNGIAFLYPGSGGGPGPLTVVTSTLSAGTAGTSYSQILTASGGTLPYSWGVVAGLGSLPTGLSLSAAGTISGTPSTAGTYNFTVKVTDAASATAQKALSIVVSAAGALPLDSQFVSQTVPTTLQPGQSFNVNMKFLNTGTQTWSGSLFYLASQNPALNSTWGGNALSLSTFVVSPGQQLDVTFGAFAPAIPGTYNFQWQAYKNDGTGFFGQPSSNVAILVGSTSPPPVDDAGFVTQSVPTSMTAGRTASVSVTMSNTGTTTWAAGTYYLGSQNPQAGMTWGLNRVNLGSAVAPSSQGTFTFNVTAPLAAGQYNFQWQMSNGTGYFGQMSTNVAISVSSARHATMMDFDNDGKSDITFYRDGLWGVLRSSQGFGTGTAEFFSWGSPGVAPIVSDFDGDGKADLAYIVPPAGGQSATYAILKSSTGYSFAAGQVLFVPAGFPSLGDTPVVGDFDGDGKADPGIWRASQGVWILPLSSANYSSFVFAQWGQSGDIPVVCDIDGDGKADIGFYRNGLWGFLKSTQNYSAGSPEFFSWGGPGLPPVVGDFDGDGKADIGYVIPESGGQSAAYAILLSSRNYSFAAGQPLFVPAGFPTLGDTPVIGDFDGDGKADPAIWRPSQGAWIIPLSSANYNSFIITQWGQAGDIPLKSSLTQY